MSLCQSVCVWVLGGWRTPAETPDGVVPPSPTRASPTSGCGKALPVARARGSHHQTTPDPPYPPLPPPFPASCTRRRHPPPLPPTAARRRRGTRNGGGSPRLAAAGRAASVAGRRGVAATVRHPSPLVMEDATKEGGGGMRPRAITRHADVRTKRDQHRVVHTHAAGAMTPNARGDTHPPTYHDCTVRSPPHHRPPLPPMPPHPQHGKVHTHA